MYTIVLQYPHNIMLFLLSIIICLHLAQASPGNITLRYSCNGEIIEVPVTCPATSIPTISPESHAPTTSPTSSPASRSPTMSPMSLKPTTSPSTSPMSHEPTTSPTTSPTQSVPTDVLWVIDGSNSMIQNSIFDDVKAFLQNYTLSLGNMGPLGTRQAYLVYAGESVFQPGVYEKLGPRAFFTNSSSTSSTEFSTSVGSLVAPGGSTATNFALNYAKEHMLVDSDLRPGSRRILMLVTDSGPTDDYGSFSATYDAEVESTVDAIKLENGVEFGMIKFEEMIYPTNWLDTQVNYSYEVAIENMESLLGPGFLNV